MTGLPSGFSATLGTDWWTLIPGGASALVALCAFWLSYRLSRRALDQQRTAQAALVFAIQEAPRPNGSVKVTVHNGSTLPIWEVQVNPRSASKLQLVAEQPTLPTIMPGKDLPFYLTVSTDDCHQILDPVPSLSFVDNSGREWNRVGGELILVRGRRRRIGVIQAAVHDLLHYRQDHVA